MIDSHPPIVPSMDPLTQASKSSSYLSYQHSPSYYLSHIPPTLSLLPIGSSDHPMERAITFAQIKKVANLLDTPESPNTFKTSFHGDIIPQVRALSFQALMTYGSPIDDTIIHQYLCNLSPANPTIKFLGTNFHREFSKHGWEMAYCKYFLHENSSQYSKCINHKPTLFSLIIIIPIHVHQSHWVIVTRRIVGDKIFYFYTNDLNSSDTEESLHNLYSPTSSLQFFPSGSSWVHCLSYTYHPHSNECGPRSLIAATIMSLHSSPSRNILVPFMHPNIGQICRWWVASSIISLHVTLSPFQHPSSPEVDSVTYPSLHMEATPYNLPLMNTDSYKLQKTMCLTSTLQFRPF
jgi:hypothetical protein